MKILLLSSHPTLEYDEGSIFHKLGHEVFSVGHYADPRNPVDCTKPGQPFPYSEELYSLFCKYHQHEKYFNRIGNLKCGDLPPYCIRLNREFTKRFDAVIIYYYHENLTLNWPVIKDKFVVLRTICQLAYHKSSYINKIKVVHLAGTEDRIHGRKCDWLIRHACDTKFHSGYVGGSDTLLTVQKWMLKRGEMSSFDFYEKISRPFNRLVCGFANEDLPYGKSGLSQEAIQQYRQSCGVYYSPPSKPGNLTYSFIEALSTGCPVITCGKKIGNFLNYNNFEADNFIKNGINGFWSDDVKECQEYIRYLLDKREEAKIIGANGRLTALKNFSLERASKDWKEFLDTNA